MHNPGMRIKKSFDRPERALIEAFRGIPAANIADVTARLFAMDARISPMGRGREILGPALTVKSSMADNFIFHKAFLRQELARAYVSDIMDVREKLRRRAADGDDDGLGDRRSAFVDRPGK